MNSYELHFFHKLEDILGLSFRNGGGSYHGFNALWTMILGTIRSCWCQYCGKHQEATLICDSDFFRRMNLTCLPFGQIDNQPDSAGGVRHQLTNALIGRTQRTTGICNKTVLLTFSLGVTGDYQLAAQKCLRTL